MKKYFSPKILITGGCITLLATIGVGWYLIPFVVEQVIIKQLRLVNGTDVFEAWNSILFPIHLYVYIWNVTNANDVVKGALPILKEVGPYVYEEKRQRINVTGNPERGTISYSTKVTYTFRPEMSKGHTESELVTVINVPYVGIISASKHLPSILQFMIKEYITQFGEKPFITKDIGTLLFDGYHIPLLESVQNAAGLELVKDSVFSMFLSRNGSIVDGRFEIYNGVKDISKFGEIVNWNGKNELDFWYGDHCNKINGSDGSVHPPFVTKDRIIRAFNPEMCRSMYMTFSKEVSELIPAYRFTFPNEVFDGTHPENECFCPRDENDNIKCTAKGSFSISACNFSAAGIISRPHFLGGDENIIKRYNMTPSQDLHDSYTDLEPYTGFTVKAQAKAQLNVEIRDFKRFPGFKKFNDTTLPVLWTSLETSMYEPYIFQMKFLFIYPLMMIYIGKILLVALSSIAVLVGIVLHYNKRLNWWSLEYFKEHCHDIQRRHSEKGQLPFHQKEKSQLLTIAI